MSNKNGENFTTEQAKFSEICIFWGAEIKSVKAPVLPSIPFSCYDMWHELISGDFKP